MARPRHLSATRLFHPTARGSRSLRRTPVLETQRYDDELWIYDLRAATAAPLGEAARRSFSSPQWSPIRNALAFIAVDAATRQRSTLRYRSVVAAPATFDRPAPVSKTLPGVRRHGHRSDRRRLGRRRSAARQRITTASRSPTKRISQPQRSRRCICGRSTSRGSARTPDLGAWSVADTTLSWSPDGRTCCTCARRMPFTR